MGPSKKRPRKPRAEEAGSALNARIIKASEFKAKCLELMDEVRQRGISVVVTKRGTPVAKLGPVDETPPNPIGFLRGTVVSDPALVGPEHDAWAKTGTDPL